MQNLIAIAPVLGAYDRPSAVAKKHASHSFGNPKRARYALGMTGSKIDWSSEERGEALVLTPNGRVDETTADDFKNQMVSAVETGLKIVVIDLSNIAYMSSRGLRALTLAQRAANGSDTTIVLARPNETMREILAISRYDMVFRVADTIEDAIGH
jgi:anti-anti-sigma factor